MRRFTVIALLALLTAGTGYAQQQRVSDGTAPAATNADALLDLQTTNKGLLLPRVPLVMTTNPSPLSAHVKGMYVYNTATAGDVTPGPYSNDGTRWQKVLTDPYPAYFTRLTWSGSTDQVFPVGQSTDINGITWTIPQSGYYLVVYHSFLRFNVPSPLLESVNFRLYNTSFPSNYLVYCQVPGYVDNLSPWLNTHVTGVFYAQKGDAVQGAINNAGPYACSMVTASQLGARNAVDIVFIGTQLSNGGSLF